MRHPLEKFIRFEQISFILVGIIAIFILMKGFTILISIALIFLSLNLASSAMIKWHMNDRQLALYQLIRALILFIIATFILLK